MKGWIVLIVLYVAVVIGGGSAVILRRDPGNRDWLATRPLPSNHRVTAGDLKEPASANALGVSLPDVGRLEGRFVVDPIPENKPVKPSNLRPDPAITPRKGQSVFWVPIGDTPGIAASVDAGVRVDLCGFDKTCVSGEVAAVRCDAKVPPACAAGIWLGDTDRTKVLGGDRTKLLILVPASRREGGT